MICPHCGCEIGEKRKGVKKPRRRRLPNGFGSITELKGRRLNKPFLARITVGKNEYGKPVLRTLDYFKTYNEAYAALLKYNQSPYDLDADITVKELYDRWIEFFIKESASGNARHMEQAFRYCGDMYSVKVRDIRARHVKFCIENGTYEPKEGEVRHTSAGTKERIKTMWNCMLDYALEYEIVDKNYARTFSLSDKVFEEKKSKRREHLPFTEDEIVKLWSLCGMEPIASLILIQCYTGLRPNELLGLKRTAVGLNSETITGGSKTEAGRNRVIPIHPAILPLVKSHYNFSEQLGTPWLFNAIKVWKSGKEEPRHWTYNNYYRPFNEFIEKYHFDSRHRPHDPRKTFVTEAKKAGLDDNVIKILVGHAIDDITESIYTKRDLEWLRADLEKIQLPASIQNMYKSPAVSFRV